MTNNNKQKPDFAKQLATALYDEVLHPTQKLERLEKEKAELEKLNQELVEVLEEVRWCLDDRADDSSSEALRRSVLMPKKVKQALANYYNQSEAENETK